MTFTSGDRVPTGTGVFRRRLTLAEAEAGALPEPFTKLEWQLMRETSRQLLRDALCEALDP
jgi:hypothetical protein